MQFEIEHTNGQIVKSQRLAELSAQADALTSATTFAQYHSRIAENTIQRHYYALQAFSGFIGAHGVDDCPTATDLQANEHAWQQVTYGLVNAFVLDLVHKGYAVGSINSRLSSIKAYAKLAYRAGTIDLDTYTAITALTGYSHNEGKNLDNKRTQTRIGYKKAENKVLDTKDATALKHQPATPQGYRDALLMCLLLDHGLRCGEVASMKVDDINLADGTMSVYRAKVKKAQTHKLSMDTLQIACLWLAQYAPKEKDGYLLCGSRKGGKLTADRMSERAITKRVQALGEDIGIDSLSAHDCRHTWATNMARQGYSLDRLMHAGGWGSYAMPLRYIEAEGIANDGMKTSY